MRFQTFLFFAVFVSTTRVSIAQETFPVNGIHDERPEVFALKNAIIHTDYHTSISNGIIVIEKGVIKAVGNDIAIPSGAVVYDFCLRLVFFFINRVCWSVEKTPTRGTKK